MLLDRFGTSNERGTELVDDPAAATTTVGGIRLAHPYLSQHTDGSTPRSSLYMSEGSVTGSELPPYYQSSTHIPGYTSTDDSSTYRVSRHRHLYLSTHTTIKCSIITIYCVLSRMITIHMKVTTLTAHMYLIMLWTGNKWLDSALV